MYVKTQFVDAGTGRTPVRSGPELPHPDLAVTFVDRRAMPATVYGTLPDDATIDDDVTEVLSDSDYQAAFDSYVDHRRAILQGTIEAADITDSQRTTLLDDAAAADTLDGLRLVSADLQAITDEEVA